jgi:uncharacterized protein YggU (UPF0235/DUF167 family)
MPPAAPFRAEAGGVRLRVRLTPRGGRDAIDGIERRDDGEAVVKARVRAAPEKGAANAALEALVAKALGVPRSTVAVVGGATSRIKTLHVGGDPVRVAALCAERFG